MKNSVTFVFSDVVNILDQAVGGADQDIGVHGPFWRDISRDEFIKLEVFDLPLIDRNSPRDSNLLRALKGENPFDGSEFPQMPAWLDPVEPENIDKIADWIERGCQ